MNSPDRICLVPHLTGAGGPSVFQHKLASGLKKQGIDVTYHLGDPPYRAVLVIGGTRHLPGIWRARQSNIPIIQRLNGMNWIHRQRWTGLRHYLRAEYGNLNLRYIRRRLANRIVYQSNFAQQWWEQQAGALAAPTWVIYNGVDLQTYSPNGPPAPPDNRYRVLLVEGNLAGGYDVGLEHAAALVERINNLTDLPVELTVAGNVSMQVKSKMEMRTKTTIIWAGHLPQAQIPALDRSAHLLFSADINAACPNSVIEAMACGLPVLALESGSLPEIIQSEAGLIAPYGGNPWSLDPPDLDGLAQTGLKILNDQDRFRRGARIRAEEKFGLEQMVQKYLKALEY